MKSSYLFAAAMLGFATPALADPYAYNWSGPYLGIHAGGAWGDASTRDDKKDGVTHPGPFAYNPQGAFGGGTVGYNWQIAGIVVGIEADLGYMNLVGDGIIPSDSSSHQTLTLDGGLYGDATGRIGFLVLPTTLVYGKGGFAFYDGQAKQTSANPGYFQTGTDTFTGWTIGGGVEHFISHDVSVKIEFQHFDFGSQVGSQTSVTDPPIGHVYHNWTDVSADSLKLGVDYHF